jgi:hypothetical protein
VDAPRRRPGDPHPRIGGYGGHGAPALAAALCATCPADVHGHVEVFAQESMVRVRVGLLCGAAHDPWVYDVVCDPWEVDGAVGEIVLAAWR